MENIIFKGQFAFSIKDSIVTVWIGTRHIPFDEWKHIGHFHETLIDEIVDGLTLLKSVIK